VTSRPATSAHNMTHAAIRIRSRHRRTFIAAFGVIAALTFAAPAHADDDAFIQAITGDGISMDRKEAILQAHAVCLFLGQPGGASIMDAIEQVKQQRASWSTVTATHFVDRSIQNYCPDKAPTASGGSTPSSGGPTVQQQCDAQKWPQVLPNAVGRQFEDVAFDNGFWACVNIAAIAPDGHDVMNDKVGSQSWRITSQSPQPGTPVAENQTVTFKVSP